MRALAALTCDVDCPVRRSVDLLASKWTLLIVRDLLVEPRRFGELLITLGGVSPKVLTDLGRELRPVIDALVAWGMRLSAAAGRRP